MQLWEQSRPKSAKYNEILKTQERADVSECIWIQSGGRIDSSLGDSVLFC